METAKNSTVIDWIIFFISTVIMILMLMYMSEWFWVALPFVLTYPPHGSWQLLLSVFSFIQNHTGASGIQALFFNSLLRKTALFSILQDHVIIHSL